MRHTLLGGIQQGSISFAHREPVAGPLVVGGEARRVGRAGDFAVEDLFEGVLAAEAVGGGDVHEMHFFGWFGGGGGGVVVAVGWFGGGDGERPRFRKAAAKSLGFFLPASMLAKD